MSKRVSNKKGKREGVKLGRQRVRLGWRRRMGVSIHEDVK